MSLKSFNTLKNNFFISHRFTTPLLPPPRKYCAIFKKLQLFYLNSFFLIFFFLFNSNSFAQTTIEINVTATGSGGTEVTSGDVNAALNGNSRSEITNVTFSNADDITSIGSWAFEGCSSLAEVTLPANLESIRNSAFEGCSSLAEVTFPANLESIENGAFKGCLLAEVTLPVNLKSIGPNVFFGCGLLVKVTFPANLESIGELAFSNCSSLSKVTLPANLESIGGQAFRDCNLLSEITFLSCAPPPLIADNLFTGLTGLTLEVPKGCSGNYSGFSWVADHILTEFPLLLKIGGDLIIKGNSKVKFGK